MIKSVLRWIAVGLVLASATVLGLYLNRRDPWGPLPGKRVTGEEVPGPVNWSFLEPSTRVTLEVRPSDPYSVDNRAFLHEGVLYLNSIRPENRWTRYLLADPNLRLKVRGKIYRVRATRVEDPELVEAIHRAREAMSRGRLGQRTDEERARNGYFRVDPR